MGMRGERGWETGIGVAKRKDLRGLSVLLYVEKESELVKLTRSSLGTVGKKRQALRVIVR